MNLFLAKTLTIFNSILALGIIAGGLIVAYLVIGGDMAALRPLVGALESLLDWALTPAGRAVVIAVVTLMVVAYLCGIVAFLSLMESHLSTLGHKYTHVQRDRKSPSPRRASAGLARSIQASATPARGFSGPPEGSASKAPLRRCAS